MKLNKPISRRAIATTETTKRLRATGRKPFLNSPGRLGAFPPQRRFTLATGGYQRLETNNGTFLLPLKDAQPYLNGFRLTLTVGNPTSATYIGFKLKAKWGKAMPEDGGNY